MMAAGHGAIEVSKYHGLGNDFLLVFGRKIGPELSAAMCDRHFGIGGDGVIEIAPSEEADFSFRLYNSDGSAAEVSGNGLRCAGKFLFEKGYHGSTSISIEAGGQLKSLELVEQGGVVSAVRADMGTATDLGEIELQGMTWRRILTGNPHAVTFVDALAAAPVTQVGPLIENDPSFPERTNVEFVETRESELHVRFWERGVGVTLSSGSGSCAALVASGLDRATVHTPGGDLLVEKDSDGRIFMTGPAVHVFDATVSEEWQMNHSAERPMLQETPL